VVLLVLGRKGKLQKVQKRVGKRMSQLRNTWYNMKGRQDYAPRKGNNVCIPLNKPLLVLFVFWLPKTNRTTTTNIKMKKNPTRKKE
jgi:Sec-independent protein translocase protein TatA